jgi:cyclomaltodextrinase / maltogenic alpha-amylase / neopullulanase
VLPSWVPGRTLYHVHALGAGGGLDTVTAWLDHVVDLGCGVILLSPIHASSTHGYDTIDPFRVDDRLGGDTAFDRFLEGAHARDLRVVLDGVFNHVGRGFPRTELLSGGSWEGHEELRELDHAKPEVLELAIEIARHWLGRGIDGWRIDVAYTIPRPFLRALTAAIHELNPEALVFGEMIHGDYAGFTADTGLHGVTQYEVFKAIWSSLNDGNCWELAHALTRHASVAAASTPVTFLGNHDVTRIRSNLRDERHLEHALAVLFTVAGIPCTYYGDEFGWTGIKEDRAGGDDAIRQPLVHGEVDERFRRWIGFRRDHPELTDAPLEVLDKTNRTLAYRTGDLTVSLDIDGGVTIE